jgi:electron transfer flavoprotein alpha subunit
MAKILVWSERPTLSCELLAKARCLADQSGGEVSLCVSGEVAAAELDSYAGFGADVVYLTNKASLDPAEWVGFLALLVADTEPSLVLVGATKTGMEVAARLAERCEASYAAWAVDIELDPASVQTRAACMLYAGAGVASYEFLRPLTVLSVAEGTFQAAETKGRTARVEALVIAESTCQLTVIGQRAKSAGGPRLEEAKAIVDIGRGVKDLEDLDLVRQLAKLLDGQLSCSRPVSSDRDWLPDWLGLSGAKVKPELCLTLGISGAIQHVVGIRESRVIAAVNNDAEAAIFAQADVGVVADLAEFLPILIERLQARGAEPAWSQ